jgi:DNA polymerase-1
MSDARRPEPPGHVKEVVFVLQQDYFLSLAALAKVSGLSTRTLRSHLSDQSRFGQIQLRLAAVMAQDEVMLAAYRAGADLHVKTAAAVLGIAEEAVTAANRQTAKALNFGLLYSMGAPRLRQYAYDQYRVTLSLVEAERLRARFFQTYPGIARWHRETAADLRARGSLDTRTLAGRRRCAVTQLPEALNTPVQGGDADCLKIALARLFQHRNDVPEAQLIAAIHDEVLAECPAEMAEHTASWLRTHMIAATQALVGDAVPIVVDVQVGDTWAR